MTDLLADVAPESEGVSAAVLAVSAGVFVVVAVVVAIVVFVRRRVQTRRRG